jgi:hypothetical protein
MQAPCVRQQSCLILDLKGGIALDARCKTEGAAQAFKGVRSVF